MLLVYRFLWVAVSLANMAIFMWFMIVFIADVYTYPSHMKLTATPSYTIPFPAISVCNINTMDVSRIAYGEALEYVSF